MTRAFSFLFCLPLCLGVVEAAVAQPPVQGVPSRTDSATPTNDSIAGDAISLDDYLALLARISPAAREGAMAYLQAFQIRCRRTLSVNALRQAVSEGAGDPILMAMVRASDPSQRASREATLKQLALRIRCDTPRAP